MYLKSLSINLMTYGEFEGQYQGKIEFAERKDRFNDKTCHAMTLDNNSCEQIVELAARGLMAEAETLAAAMVAAVQQHGKNLLARHDSEDSALEHQP